MDTGLCGYWPEWILASADTGHSGYWPEWILAIMGLIFGFVLSQTENQTEEFSDENKSIVWFLVKQVQ